MYSPDLELHLLTTQLNRFDLEVYTYNSHTTQTALTNVQNKLKHVHTQRRE